MPKNDFPDKKHVVLPVIHVSNVNQALANATIAKRAGCDGIFLINHNILCNDLLYIYQAVRNIFPDWWIGLNFLDLAPREVFEVIPESASAIWTDNAMINEQTEHQNEPELIAMARKKSGWKGMYFGGVAFKYQSLVDNVERATELAIRYMDVITTSGRKTGSPPDPEKISRMKKVAGNVPLAIASGISVENVKLYPECQFFLVATSISRNFYNLDPSLTEELINAVK